MKKLVLYITIILLFQLSAVNISAQTCGFGCLGLSGIYGGYSFQNYDANNLSEYIQSVTSISTDAPSFGKGNGFKFGANIFRAKFDDFFLTAKGFYQFSDENYEVAVSTGILEREKYELNTDNFGFGLDIGIDVVQFLSLKIIEGGITFHDSELKITNSFKGDSIQDVSLKYTNDNLKIGYYLGSGIILHLIENYVSIEGTAFYSSYNIENLSRESQTGEPIYLLADEDSKTISSGGFGASVQLNIGFPFN